MIISGKEISTKIKDQLKEEVEQMKNKYAKFMKNVATRSLNLT